MGVNTTDYYSHIQVFIAGVISSSTGSNPIFHFTEDELISPCMCKGTQQFVHRSCLDHWRSIKAIFFILVLLRCSCFRLSRICLFPILFSYDFNQSERILVILQEGFAFSHCTTCKAQFHLKVSLFEDNSWRKVKFRLFVARDVLLVFLAVQTVSSLKTSYDSKFHSNSLFLECMRKLNV